MKRPVIHGAQAATPFQQNDHWRRQLTNEPFRARPAKCPRATRVQTRGVRCLYIEPSEEDIEIPVYYDEQPTTKLSRHKTETIAIQGANENQYIKSSDEDVETPGNPTRLSVHRGESTTIQGANENQQIMERNAVPRDPSREGTSYGEGDESTEEDCQPQKEALVGSAEPNCATSQAMQAEEDESDDRLTPIINVHQSGFDSAQNCGIGSASTQEKLDGAQEPKSSCICQ
eukprot:gb/GECG01011520.1/.p1 GENE.gb/GECG01011520.1/~~gb/GECG01011520.1/.p1  ORF type:complete len:230 (+),score=26.08 gb/GECG01011520.1/:1-690(+)